MSMQDDADAERCVVAGHVQAAVDAVNPGSLVTKFVLIAVRIDAEGDQTTSCWTSPDQRQWDTLGLIEFVKADHYAYLAKLRAEDET